MDREVAELKKKLAESEARAVEEQRLREEEQLKSKQAEARATEEQRLREEEQLKSKQAEARATEEQRLREEEQLKSKQAEARATEEQRLREEEQLKSKQAEARATEEQRLREEEQLKSKQAEARATEEQRLREAEQRRREAAEAHVEQAQPKILVEYLRACHEFSLAINIITDKTLTTKGETTKPAGRPFPKRIVPWADFPIQQEQVWEKLSISPNFHSQHVFPSSHQLEYVQKYLVPINSELSLRHYARDTVENPVRTLIEEVYKDEKLQEQLQLRGTVMFESHTNLGQAASESLTGEMEGMSMTDTNTEGGGGEAEGAGVGAGGKGTAKGKGRKKGTAKRSKQRAGRRARIADQFCIYELLDGKRMPVVSIEYKAPHKLSLAEIIAGLDGEIRPAEEIINQEGDDFKFLSKSLGAAVITQLFSDMIGKGVQRGYVFVGNAIIFLQIPDNPTMVYYHVSIPSLDFQEDDVNRFHRTSVAQIFAFVLGALTAAPPGQAWHDKAEGLDTWAVEYIDILKKIPETELKKRRESLSYRATRWKGFARSPIRTRSSGVVVTCNPSRDDPTHDDDEGDDNDTPPTPTPQRITRQRGSRGKAETVKKGGARGGRSKTSASSKDVKEVTSRPSIEERQYCTHQCLLGLAHGGSMDRHCPNFLDHEGEHISRAKFLRLIRLQLATDRGRDADCTPLYIKGSRGALFKIRLSSHGYTLLAKGMEEEDRDHLVQECKVYQHVRSIQGIHVPVCMGMVDLKLPYYYDFGIYVTMLFLSWGGRSIYQYLNQETADQISDKAGVALHALHELKVMHNDAEPRNMLWDEQHDSLMLVDFERAEIRVRQPLSTITANRKRKRQVKSGAAVQDVDFDGEIQSARREISRCII